jgi:hypothetical protein
MRERDIEAKFRDLCKSLGWSCIKLMKTSLVGIPDRLVITRGGVVVFVELKAPNGRVSKIQARVHECLAEHNLLVLVGCDHYKLASSVALYAGEYTRWRILLELGDQKSTKKKP